MKDSRNSDFWKIPKEWVTEWGLTGNEALLLADMLVMPSATIEQRAERVNMTGRSVINILNRFRDSEKISPNIVKKFHQKSEKISPKKVKNFHQKSQIPPHPHNILYFNNKEKEEEGERARTRESGPEIVIEGIVDFFQKIGGNYIPDFREETTAATELASKINHVMAAEEWIVTEESARTWWGEFLERAWKVCDPWQRNHFDVKTLNSQFNNFINKIKLGNNGKENGGTGSGITRGYIERKMREAGML